MMKFSQLSSRGESHLEPKFKKVCQTDFELFLILNFLVFKKSVLQILSKLSFNLLVPSLSLGTLSHSFWPFIDVWILQVHLAYIS